VNLHRTTLLYPVSNNREKISDELLSQAYISHRCSQADDAEKERGGRKLSSVNEKLYEWFSNEI